MIQQIGKNEYLSKDEMIRFLKSKGIIIDPRTRNFPRFAKNNGIIFKKIERVGSGGRATALYIKPMQEKILKILEGLKKTNNSLVGRKIVKQKEKLVLSIFDKIKEKDKRPKNEKVYRTTIAEKVVEKLDVKTSQALVRKVLDKKRKFEIHKKLNKPI